MKSYERKYACVVPGARTGIEHGNYNQINDTALSLTINREKMETTDKILLGHPLLLFTPR
jgi:hypothetical protein